MISRFTLALRSAVYYRRLNLVTVAGAALGAAVICGAIITGDSFQGTMRDRALRRLGRIDYALRADGMVRAALASELAAALNAADRASGERRAESAAAAAAAAVLYAHGTARRPADSASGKRLVRSRAEVYGVDPSFSSLFADAGVLAELKGTEAVVSRSLAARLGIGAGDSLILDLERPADAPAMSLFLHRSEDDAVVSMRVNVKAVISGGASVFSLRHTDYNPPNVYVRRSLLERRLEAGGLVNVVLLHTPALPAAVAAALGGTARLADYGLRIRRPGGVSGAFQIEARRLVIPGGMIPILDSAASANGGNLLPVSFYLANTIALENRRVPGKRREVPYSVIGAAATPVFDPPLRLSGGGTFSRALRADEILVNAWTADQIGLVPGDLVRVDYFASRTDEHLENATVRLRVAGILAMDSPLEDPDLVPEYKGITDAVSVSDWNPPFPLDLSRITEADELYWRRYRTTPKAIVSQDLMRRMWTPRAPDGAFLSENADWITTLRVRSPQNGAESAFERAACRGLSRSPYALRMRAVRTEALRASRGSSDFRGLFLGLGMFLVGAAAAFAALALRLNLTRRAREVGLLLTVGWSPGRVWVLMVAESAVLTVLAVVIGAAGGVLYARLLISGLSRRWRSIMGSLPALDLHVAPGHVAGAAAAGAVVTMTIGVLAAIRLTKRRPLDLLAGWRASERRMMTEALRLRGSRYGGGGWAGLALTGIGVVLVVLGLRGVASPVAAFFSGGACLLIGLVVLTGAWLRPRRPRGGDRRGLSRVRLAWRANTVSRARSLLVLGIPACGIFMLLAVASGYKHVDPLVSREKQGPTGGYELRIRSELPLRRPLDRVLAERCDRPAERRLLNDVRIESCRLSSGDAASCLNIQLPVTPRVLAVSPAFIRRGGFSFRAVDSRRLRAAGGKPWDMLLLADDEGVLPAFADADSARWILHKNLGDFIPVPTPSGRIVRLRLVGLLEPGILAGDLVVGEPGFLRYFSRDAGFRTFFADLPEEKVPAFRRLLAERAGDFGIEVESTRTILARLFAVQNAYIAVFATLGGLGLTLGMVGLILVLLREAEERRGEFALLSALGFSKASVVMLLALQVGFLLLAGLVIGLASGVAGIGPYFVTVGIPFPWRMLAATTAGIAVIGMGAVISGAVAAASGSLVTALRRE